MLVLVPFVLAAIHLFGLGDEMPPPRPVRQPVSFQTVHVQPVIVRTYGSPMWVRAATPSPCGCRPSLTYRMH